jgi:hypothetical protein
MMREGGGGVREGEVRIKGREKERNNMRRRI